MEMKARHSFPLTRCTRASYREAETGSRVIPMRGQKAWAANRFDLKIIRSRTPASEPGGDMLAKGKTSDAAAKADADNRSNRPEALRRLQANIWALWMLNISFCVTALLFIAVGWSLWGAIDEIRNISHRLEELRSFESRISRGVDLVNTGLQNRLEKIDQRISNIQSKLNSTEAVFGSAASRSGPTTPRFNFGSGRRPTPSQEDAESADQRVAPPAGGLAPSPLFRRTETPDGKVRYEKIN